MISFEELMEKWFAENIERYEHLSIDGKAEDWGSYRQIVGVIKGLRMSRNEFKALIAKHRKDGE